MGVSICRWMYTVQPRNAPPLSRRHTIIGIRCIEHYAHPHIISIETRVCGAFVREVPSRRRRARERGKEREEKGESDTCIGKRFRLHRPRGIDDRHSAVMNYSPRNVELIAYNAAVRDAIPRIQRYTETIYRLIPKAIPLTLKYTSVYTFPACPSILRSFLVE